MKSYNRRDFLKLTGLTALALTFSACGSSAPSVPSQDAQSLFAAINAYRKEKGLKELVYSKAIEDYAKFDMQCFATVNSTTANLENWHFTSSGNLKPECYSIQAALDEEGFDTYSVQGYGTKETFVNGEGRHTLNKLYPETESDWNTQMAELVTALADSTHIGIALVRIDGNLYWYALAFKKSASV